MTSLDSLARAAARESCRYRVPLRAGDDQLLSDRLAREPRWVLDYVIVHELAHLHVRGHGKAFWDLVDRYPLMERARGFLIARGVEDPDDAAGTDTVGGV